MAEEENTTKYEITLTASGSVGQGTSPFPVSENAAAVKAANEAAEKEAQES